jgi:hypothetical protein
MSIRILVADDEHNVAELFPKQFRRKTRQGTYILHYVTHGRRHWIGSEVKSSPPRWGSSLAI